MILGLLMVVEIFVSMKSGLEGRNNGVPHIKPVIPQYVSMKSGLEGRNNGQDASFYYPGVLGVSMKSGLEGRNNAAVGSSTGGFRGVSMKSGLEGRNNSSPRAANTGPTCGLNEVRPRRPEQSRKRRT